MPRFRYYYAMAVVVVTNAIPVVGWFLYQWDFSIVALIYLVESYLVGIFALLRILYNQCPIPWKNRYGMIVKIGKKSWRGPTPGNENGETGRVFLTTYFGMLIVLTLMAAAAFVQGGKFEELLNTLRYDRNYQVLFAIMAASYLADYTWSYMIRGDRYKTPLHDIFFLAQLRTYPLGFLCFACAAYAHMPVGGNVPFFILITLKMLLEMHTQHQAMTVAGR